MPPKNIVFCADGTWNGPGETDHDDPHAPASNVFKLFLSLPGKDMPGASRIERERALTAADGSVTQAAKYLHGVGDSENFLVKLLGGALGAGLITRIVRGYTFVSRNYVAGDRIYLVGFSRGAYTARALAGLIAAKGLLDATQLDLTDKTAAYRLGSAVWYQWRRDKLIAAGQPLSHLEEIVIDLPGFLARPPDPATLIAAPIETVAVWDTVGALGIPIFSGQHVAVDVFQFADTTLSPIVHHGRHAVSIDDRREDFTPTLWDPAPGRIVQVLFPGAHADIGGGQTTSNNESGLSDGALAWMRAELAALGVAFTAPLFTEKPDPAGTAHRPWTDLPWSLLPKAPRVIPTGLGLSQSVIVRIDAGPVVPAPGVAVEIYRPANIAAYLDSSGLQPAPGIVPV